MEDDKYENVRKHPRVAWSFLARYKLHDASDETIEVSPVRNISAGGCYLGVTRGKTTFVPGGILDIWIKFPGAEPFYVKGEIKRCDPGEGQVTWFVGIQFINMDPARTTELVNKLAFFIKKKKK